MRDTRANSDETNSDRDVRVLGFFFRDRAGEEEDWKADKDLARLLTLRAIVGSLWAEVRGSVLSHRGTQRSTQRTAEGETRDIAARFSEGKRRETEEDLKKT